MKPKVAALRAFTAYLALRSLRILSLFVYAVLGVLTLVVGLLAYYFTTWWLVFLVPILVVLFFFLLLRFLVTRVISTIHRHPFTAAQRESLEQFTQKFANLAALRAVSLPGFAYLTLRDILKDRDATTIRERIHDSKTLKSDFSELEKHFGDRS